jgi:hypothetical protein
MYGRPNSQVSAVVPDGICEVATEGVDEDLVLVELEDDVREPPVAAALHGLAVSGDGRAGRGCDRVLDDIWDGDALREREAAAREDADGEGAGAEGGLGVDGSHGRLRARGALAGGGEGCRGP